MQLYLYDTVESIAHQIQRSPNLDENLIRLIRGALRDNPYVQAFKSLGSLSNIQEYAIELNTNEPHYIRAYHGCYDPLTYPLFLSHGETGWEDKKIEFQDPPQSQLKRKYTKHKRQLLGSIVFHASRLFQQLLVEWYVKVESMHVDWYSKPAHQALIYADLLLDTLATGEPDASKAGLRIVLSKDFPGSDQDVQARFMNAMTLVTWYGKLDYFVTMTCNPYQKEIMADLLPGQMTQDCPDVVARVYHAKLLDLHDFLIKKGHLGTVAAWAHVTKFQKRGLPHEHFLLVMESESKLKSPDDYDTYISAEIPYPKIYYVLHRLVCKHTMHGPCGALGKDYPCMMDGHHINVEVCSSIKLVKYLYNYIYKGHDRALYTLNAKGNEKLVINEINMQVHLPGMHMVSFKSTDNLKDVVRCEKSQKSMLTEYFKMNASNPEAYKYLHKEFSELQIKRLVYANPNEGERYYLRVLLTHVRGATSYENLKTWHGATHETFRKAAKVMGFVETNKSIDECLTESAMFTMPCSLRRLVATIIVFCECANIRRLWNKHFDSLAKDLQHKSDNSTVVEQMVFRDISYHLTSMGKDISHYGLPKLQQSDDERTRDHYRELTEEQNLGFGEEHLKIINTLNAEQRAGGTGKTYLYKALLVRSMDLIVVATTSSIAASIMPGGRTAHYRFKTPIKLGDSTMCSFTKQTKWDSRVVEALDRTLQDVMGCTDPFGGKVMLFRGDFRQVLPVMARGTRAQITDATLMRSYIWESKTSIDTLIDRVFPNLHCEYTSAAYMRELAILSTRNEHVDAVNAFMIERFPGNKKVYYSFDSIEDDLWNNYPLDFLNSITPNGLPPHELTIKKNCPVILLRNLDPQWPLQWHKTHCERILEQCHWC
ncbi:hypothetical protein SETIT_1G185800v2 [Setaria italica]|uniref:ATP-dependent DNA helicase n=1 Tax=Setaria italica TaxID=4555 RepID=A0A368PLR3_SETIT|nr:hypothetical protein SETIT_1G185800v2 [Setaria italica]